jgi:hypothetical protein
MLNAEIFASIIQNPESSILDFKAKMYEFDNDIDLKEKAKFGKDVICFSNTIRTQSAYIIIGIEILPDGEKSLKGLDSFVDDAVLQDKIKNKLYPRPTFQYYTIAYLDKIYGILDFPITKYPTPIHPVVKMKGLEVGKIYYRRGTSNSEALGLEVISINNWFQSLPDSRTIDDAHATLSGIIKRITSGNEPLSSLNVEILQFAKRYNLSELILFSASELQGISSESVQSNPEEYNYRLQKVIISLDKYEVNPFSGLKVTEAIFKAELAKSNTAKDFQLLYTRSITDIESYLKRFEENRDYLYGTMPISSKRVLPNAVTDYPLTIYIFRDNFLALYNAIRQKMIDKLISAFSNMDAVSD